MSHKRPTVDELEGLERKRGKKHELDGLETKTIKTEENTGHFQNAEQEELWKLIDSSWACFDTMDTQLVMKHLVKQQWREALNIMQERYSRASEVVAQLRTSAEQVKHLSEQRQRMNKALICEAGDLHKLKVKELQQLAKNCGLPHRQSKMKLVESLSIIANS